MKNNLHLTEVTNNRVKRDKIVSLIMNQNVKSKYKKIMNKLVKLIKPKILKYILFNGFYFSHKGYCPCCDKKVKFYAFNNWLRDSFICSNCFSIPRERAIMIVIEKYYPNWRDLDIHESSPVNRGASLKLQKGAKKYITSQYFPDKPYGVKIESFINQDLENQTFKNESFDIVITQDVMEHIYKPEKAFKEIARTIKNGGAHIFTVPIINKHKPTEVWAIKGEDSHPVFLKIPEWHGNPIDSKGSPVTMHWGFDIANFIKEKSDLETTIEYIDDISFGIRGEFIEVFVSKKSN